MKFIAVHYMYYYTDCVTLHHTRFKRDRHSDGRTTVLFLKRPFWAKIVSPSYTRKVLWDGKAVSLSVCHVINVYHPMKREKEGPRLDPCRVGITFSLRMDAQSGFWILYNTICRKPERIKMRIY